MIIAYGDDRNRHTGRSCIKTLGVMREFREAIFRHWDASSPYHDDGACLGIAVDIHVGPVAHIGWNHCDWKTRATCLKRFRVREKIEVTRRGAPCADNALRGLRPFHVGLAAPIQPGISRNKNGTPGD